MRASEIIRDILDLIDKLEHPESCDIAEPDVIAVAYDNSPQPRVQDLASVTTAAGGGLNGPKNPADIRSDSVSMYPNFQAKN